MGKLNFIIDVIVGVVIIAIFFLFCVFVYKNLTASNSADYARQRAEYLKTLK